MTQHSSDFPQFIDPDNSTEGELSEQELSALVSAAFESARNDSDDDLGRSVSRWDVTREENSDEEPMLEGTAALEAQRHATGTALGKDGLSVSAETATDREWELLSAFLDGELTPDESLEVRQWLRERADVRERYRHLCQLQKAFDALPHSSQIGTSHTPTIPPSCSPEEEMADRVISLMERDPLLAFPSLHSLRKAVHVAAAGAIAALSGSILWQASRPVAPLVSLEAPPVTLEEPFVGVDPLATTTPVLQSRPPTARPAQSYLLDRDREVDPVDILLFER